MRSSKTSKNKKKRRTMGVVSGRTTSGNNMNKNQRKKNRSLLSIRRFRCRKKKRVRWKRLRLSSNFSIVLNKRWPRRQRIVPRRRDVILEGPRPQVTLNSINLKIIPWARCVSQLLL